MATNYQTAPFITQNALWQPLVRIEPSEIAIHLYPGSTPIIKRLSAGWVWHWPWLSTIRRYNTDIHVYVVGSHAPMFGDESIVVVSKDHHLFTITFELAIQLQVQPSNQQLAALEPKWPQTALRPLLRQQLRQIAASVDSLQLNDAESLSSNLFEAIISPLQQAGFENIQINNLSTTPFGTSA